MCRLVGLGLVLYGAIKVLWALVLFGLSFAMRLGFDSAAAIFGSLAPLIMLGAGVSLIMFDQRIARLIVPMPKAGCPGCGYWTGNRELGTCPECGLDLRDETSR